MDQNDHIEELVAQIEDRGVEKVLFMLDEGEKELYVSDCHFDGTYIVVRLGLTA